MRHDAAPAEQKLWRCLRDRQLCGLKFRRQTPIGNYVADFYCAEARLVVELDGRSHMLRQAYDDDRTNWLQARSYAVVRFSNEQVFDCLDSVLETIAEACERKL